MAGQVVTGLVCVCICNWTVWFYISVFLMQTKGIL